VSSRRYPNYIYLERHDAVFCYIPKVACTNWKCVARRLSGQPDWLNPQLAHDKVRSGLVFLDPTDASQSSLISQSRLRLAMVRNPYSRILSAYLDKVARRLLNGEVVPGNPETDYWLKVTQEIELFRRDSLQGKFREVNFEVFLHWLQQSNHRDVDNAHFASQALVIGESQIDLTYLARFENLSSDAPIILEMLGENFSFPSAAQHTTGSAGKLINYYSPASIAIVNQWFSIDFEQFNYPRAQCMSDLAHM